MKLLIKTLFIYSSVVILFCVVMQIQYFWNDFFKILILIFINCFVFYLIYFSLKIGGEKTS